jgi:hypothetical protein
MNVHSEVTQEAACAVLPKDDKIRFRVRIEEIVLATDMVHHHTMVDNISTRERPAGTCGADLLRDCTEDDKWSMLAMLVHAADISNTCRAAGPAGNWARRVTQGADTDLPLSVLSVSIGSVSTGMSAPATPNCFQHSTTACCVCVWGTLGTPPGGIHTPGKTLAARYSLSIARRGWYLGRAIQYWTAHLWVNNSDCRTGCGATPITQTYRRVLHMGNQSHARQTAA